VDGAATVTALREENERLAGMIKLTPTNTTDQER
jgi:hypothetical protein